MRDLKEVIVFSEQGDPRKIKTWSNVPYLLVTTLEARNIRVNTVSLEVEGFFQKSIRKIHEFIFSILITDAFYDYSKTSINYYLIRLKIKKAIKKYESADAFIFTTFSFSASGISNKPSIIFCDWTIEHHIKYYLDRKPKYLEDFAIKRQNDVIENADLIFVLFPVIAEMMKKSYRNPNIFYIGNVINNLYSSSQSVLQNKKIARNNLLFVGSKKYLDGAVNLIEAYKELKKNKPQLKLDIVGINSEDIGELPQDVNCYGYLDKGIESQAKVYYDLLKNASVFINTTPKWGAFSASVEAMYFYTPVIVTPYAEFTKTFGIDINFGIYYNNGDILAETINNLLLSGHYDDFCLNAFNIVSDFTWSNYVNKMTGIYADYIK